MGQIPPVGVNLQTMRKSPQKKKPNGVNGSPTPESGGRVACWQASVGQAEAGHYQATDPGCGGNQAHPAATARHLTGDEIGPLANVPIRPQAGYADGGYIDVRKLGSEPLGIQMGKNGPVKQKFLCARCNKKRWIMDSDAASAAEMTRFTLCSFCSVSVRADRRITESNSALLLQLQELQDRVDKRMSSFESRLSELESKQLQPTRDPIPSVMEEGSPRELRTEFEDLREHLNSEVLRMRSLVSARTPPREPSLPGAAVRRSGGVSSVVEMASGGSPRTESYIDDWYRRAVLGSSGRESQAPPSPSAPRTALASPVVRGSEVVAPAATEPTAQRTKKKRKKKKKRSGGPRNETQQAGSIESNRVTLLIGDSMVGGMTAKLFRGKSSGNYCNSLPGAGVRRVTEVIRKLDPEPHNTLIVSVGGNDFFRRDKKAPNIGALWRSYDTLLNLARSRTGRCVVVGLIPRMYYNCRAYAAASDFNGKLADKCRKLGFKFVNPWDTFYGCDRFYRRDGIHFTDLGSRTFAQLLSQTYFGPPRNKRSRRRRRRRSSLVLPRQQVLPVAGPVAGAPRQPTRQRPTGDTESEAVTRLVAEALANISRTTPDRTEAISDANKRRRSNSPAQDVSPTAAPPRLKRRRASEGDRPDPNSPPPRRSPLARNSQPSGNGRAPD